MRNFLFLLIIIFLIAAKAQGQFILTDSLKEDKISLFSFATIANTGNDTLSPKEIFLGLRSLNFTKLKSDNQNLGFTKDNYWVQFSIINNRSTVSDYYLETARPVTDHADLFIISENEEVSVFHNGHEMNFTDRPVDHRKIIFKLILKPKQTYKFLLHLKSYGEVISLPLTLRTSENLLHITYIEQIVFGFFYGILLLAAIIYMFFYFGLKDKSFLNYSLYVIFIALMQFSLDGYFYEYITPQGGWISQHAVLLFATVAAYFLGRYSELFLNVPKNLPNISKVFKIVYYLLGILLLLLIFVPSFLPLAYPLTNLFGMIILVLIIISVLSLSLKKLPVDNFFSTGIIFLIAGFFLFILNNFNIIPTTFLSQNSSKFGTGLEVIFISLSMANRIRRMREEREELIDNLTTSNHDLKQFTYITSHDLRAPISNLLGLLNLYDKDVETNKRNKMVMDKISESTRRLNETVSDLINILLIKNNLSIEQVPLRFNDVLKETINSIGNNIIVSKAEINSNFSAAEVVHFNKSYLESIFLNLLTNAIKFKATDRDLVVDIKTKMKDGHIQLIFSDNGSGFNFERHKEKVFGMHQHFHSHRDSKGVGLYIIKSQITSLGGQISVESEENIGTTFTITFKKHNE